MIKEQIRAAAINAANEVYDREECIEWEHLVFAFRDGAQWRICSVWHDAQEEPQRSGRLIASNKDGNYILCGPNNCNWKQTVKLFHIINWAYIMDLLPERKEETE